MKDQLKKFYTETQRTSGVSLSEDAKHRLKDEIFSKLSSPIVEEQSSTLSNFTSRFSRLSFATALVPLVAILFLAGTSIVSASALPGESLYNIKLKVEQARLLLTPTGEGKLELQIEFAQRRLEEERKVNNSTALSPEETNSNSDTSSPNEDIARERADQAIEFLNQAKQNFQQKGKHDKAQQIDEQLQKFRNEDSESGSVQGESTIETKSNNGRSLLKKSTH
jgi:hypothetical protein